MKRSRRALRLTFNDQIHEPSIPTILGLALPQLCQDPAQLRVTISNGVSVPLRRHVRQLRIRQFNLCDFYLLTAFVQID